MDQLRFTLSEFCFDSRRCAFVMCRARTAATSVRHVFRLTWILSVRRVLPGETGRRRPDPLPLRGRARDLPQRGESLRALSLQRVSIQLTCEGFVRRVCVCVCVCPVRRWAGTAAPPCVCVCVRACPVGRWVGTAPPPRRSAGASNGNPASLQKH